MPPAEEELKTFEPSNINTWTPEEGVGGSLEDGDEEAVKEMAEEAQKQLFDTQKEKEGDTEKETDTQEETKPEENEIIVSLKEELSKSKEELEELKSQMARLLEEAEASKKAMQSSDSDEEERYKQALLNTPDDELTETELKFKKYLQSLEKTVSKLEDEVQNTQKQQLIKEYQERFNKIANEYNKDGDVWIDDYDFSLIAQIAIDNNTDDIEGIAKQLVEKRKKLFEAKLEKAKKEAVKEYLTMKMEDRKKFLEKTGDAPPPKMKRDSLDSPASLIKKVAARIAAAGKST